MRFLSLFSGIEGASLAWEPLGWHCVGVAEVDVAACAVLAHHYPDVPNLGNVTKITEAQIKALGRIDIVVFGSPCQDVSIAGKRAGMKGARSGLFFTAMRIVRWSRARFALWENVPGVFSDNEGRGFAAVVGEMAGVHVDVPDGGWRNSGFFLGPEAFVEFAVLDAQFFGVPQRRRRVFALRDSGDWQSRPPILLEPESLCGNIAPSREAGQVAPTIPARSLGGGGLGTDFDCDGGVIETCPTLRAGGNRTGGDRPPGTDVDTCDSLVITHTLRADGFDASEDGTGRGTPLVPLAFHARQDPDSGYVTHPLDTDGHSIAVAFDTTQVTSRANRSNPKPGDPCHPLAAGAHPPAVAFNMRGREGGAMPELDDVASLRAASGGSSRSYIAAMAVRRLSPVECERLQGVPDDYTQVPRNGKPMADGSRYKMLGNGFAIPVIAWIGRRIDGLTK